MASTPSHNVQTETANVPPELGGGTQTYGTDEIDTGTRGVVGRVMDGIAARVSRGVGGVTSLSRFLPRSPIRWQGIAETYRNVRRVWGEPARASERP